MTSLRRYLILAALVALAVPAVALAARAKQGVYLQNFVKSGTQVSLGVAKGGRTVTVFSANCTVKGSAGSGYTITKHLGITRARKFYFHGKIKIPAALGTPPKAVITVHGRFTKDLKHAKGTVTGTETSLGSKFTCQKITFNLRYYGNPKGG